VLLLGDAAHPMVPTLGQGATQSIEDACVAVDEIRAALRAGDELSAIPARVAARRMERIRFVVDFSREATDTMLAGADPVAGTLAKTQKPFQDKLKRLYCDVALPA
jgi:2-polyprenyl-6-methoxyphenol hydroxylase-like FAD-dependent oxidoreductase